MGRYSIYVLNGRYVVEDLKYLCIQGSFERIEDAQTEKKRLETITGKYIYMK